MRLKDKVALITGAASGIGKAIAMQYADEGATVGVVDINLEAAKDVADMLTKQGKNAIAISMDVSQEDQINKGVQTLVDHAGTIDVLVSNAGFQYICPIENLSFANWRKVLAINLDAAFLLTKACLPIMYAKKQGSIIYMGSVHSKLASVLKAPYVTAKHGLIGLCRVVTKEGAEHGVRANVICPGFVYTPLVEQQIPEQAQELGISEEEVIKNVMLKDTVDGEFTALEEVAELATVFASFPGNGLTGQSLVISHGWCLD